MESPDSIVLTILLFWPLVSALLVILLGRSDSLIKKGSIGASLIPLGLSIYLLFAYDSGTGGMQFEQFAEWIPQLNAGYHLGVDGLSIPLIFLTTLLSTLSLYYSAGVINERVKEYFFLMHLLEFSMIGRLLGPGLRSLLCLLGDQPGADVLSHRNLGRRKSRLRGHQVLHLYLGGLGGDAAGDSGGLLRNGDFRHR